MRAARRTVPSVVYHLIWRFADRSFALAAEDERERYLELLGRALATTDWRCLGYALMPDRLQLAMVAGRTELSSWSRVAHSPFVRWMNHRRGRRGALIADRPIGHAVPADYEGTLLAHLHGDPVRAGQVAAPSDSAWTSHRAYAGLVAPPPWLHVTEGLRRAGFADGQGFDAWVRETLARSGELDRERCRRELRRQARLDAAMVVPPGHAVRRVEIDPRRLVAAVAEVLDVPEETLCSHRRNPVVLAGRIVATHSGRQLGLSNTEIAAALRVTPQAISKIARRAPTAAGLRWCEVVIARLAAAPARRVA